MCDRVIVLYRGRVVRELIGRGDHREQHRGGAFDLSVDAATWPP